jgi:hypothetical protein
MFSFTEMHGQSSTLHQSGTIEFNTTYVTRRKPVWLVAIKLFAVAAMVAVGFGLMVPTLLHFDFVLWQALALAGGLMMVYMGLAFFVRPEANTDNLGWAGGFANDPYQYSDNVNRFLWQAHCLLGPGRFTAETFLDFCALVGLAHEDEVIGDNDEAAVEQASEDPLASLPLPGGLNPHRFELRR